MKGGKRADIVTLGKCVKTFTIQLCFQIVISEMSY